jgi:hypothetical protein
MASQMLFYESAVPVSSARHGGWSVEVGTDYAFSRNVNSVPLMAVEIPNAATEYAVVFSGSGEAMIPAVILGMRGNENLYLTAQGGWQAKYIPAFVRRYPFVFSRSADGNTFTLCIDESFPGFNQQGRGERLFNDQNKPTPYVENVLKFLEQYQMEFRRTQAFCAKLRELDLLEPMRAQGNLDTGERISLSGFMAVNRDRLKALPAEALAELAKTDALELLYLHLQSMRNFSGMMDRLGAKRSAETGETSEAGVPAQRRLEGLNPNEKQAPDKKQPVKTRK